MSKPATPAEPTTPAASAAPVTPPATPAATPESTTPAATPAAPVADPAKPAEPATATPPAAPVVEKYDLKLPENTLLDAATISEIETYAKEHKLTNDAAQAIIEREHKALTDFADRQQQAFETAKETWKTQAMSDKEIGGDKFNENVEICLLYTSPSPRD